MSDTVIFEDREQFVYCRYTGPFALEPLLDLATEAYKYCETHDYDTILIDITESHGEMGTFQRFKHGESISKFVKKNYKIAVLAKPDQLSERIWENASRNRLLKTKVFTDSKMAEKWLR